MILGATVTFGARQFLDEELPGKLRVGLFQFWHMREGRPFKTRLNLMMTKNT